MYNFAKTAAKDPYNFDIGSSNKQPTSSVKQPANNTKQPAKKTDTTDKSKKPQNIEPKRLAIRYDPPTIIVEYLQPSSGKLYHHKMKLLKMRGDTPANHALEYLRKKHAMFFMNNKLPEKQLLELINKLIKRLQTQQQQRPTSQQRPTTASTAMSKTQSKLQKDIEDYGMSEEDLYKYAMKNHKQQPVLEDDEDEDDYEQNYEQESDEDEEITEEQYKMLYQKMGYNNLNLNKMSTDELKKHKQIMESMFQKNSVKPGDAGYKYDVQKDFRPQAANEWDMDDEDDYDIV